MKHAHPCVRLCLSLSITHFYEKTYTTQRSLQIFCTLHSPRGHQFYEKFHVFTESTHLRCRQKSATMTDNDLSSGANLLKYILLAKSAKGKGCVAVIQQVLANPSTYVFGELLEQPNVAAVSFTLFAKRKLTSAHFS